MNKKPLVFAHIGDHDREQGSLSAFYEGLPAEPLPRSLLAQGIRCLFLDVVGPGQGGPDFRLGVPQRLWLEDEMLHARGKGEEIFLFMHTYPTDLKDREDVVELNRLIADYKVALVNTGHTHYNELSNDGHTIFSATRSTGQIEEGPVGYSLVSVDAGIVSWRFKPLADAFPFVLITAPADYRLVRKKEQLVMGLVEVRATVFGARGIVRVSCREGEGAWMAIKQNEGLWKATIDVPLAKLVTLTAEAVNERGRPGRHTIRFATPAYKVPAREKNGSDANSIGAWPENGIFGTKLGPNRNART
jgi:3',5'-cyclic-AMP phosphodiesterase